MSTAKRVGLIGGAAGLLAAGAAVMLAVDRSGAARRRHAEADSPLSQSLVDRSGRVVADDGVGLYYEEVGPANAPLTVVFVHGYCLQMGEFVFQRRALAEQFAGSVRLVFYDQRSHGRSDHSDPEQVSIDQLGRDLAAVLHTLAPRGPVVLVGHSMGGMTVMALADQHPEWFAERRVVGVALLATSSGKLTTMTLRLPAALARFNAPLVPLLLRGVRRQGDLIERGRALGREVAWVFVRRFSFADADVDPRTVDFLAELIAATRIEVVADFYPALTSHDKLAALPTLRNVHVLVLCGDRDLLTPLAHSEQIVAHLPEARLVVVPDAGHVVLLERPDVVNEALAQLIASCLRPNAANGRSRR